MSRSAFTPCFQSSATSTVIRSRDFRATFLVLPAAVFAVLAMPVAHAQVVSGSVTVPPIINTFAGNGTPAYSGDNGPATSAEVNYPQAVAVDSAGNLYIADTIDNRIRKVTVATGDITTVAGDGTAGYTGDGGAATSAELNGPQGVAVDSAGNLYIADSNNNRIRKVTAATGDITTVAGNATAGYTGNGGLATSAELNAPVDVVVDSAGNLYIADSNNNVVRMVAATTGTKFGRSVTAGDIYTIAGNGTANYTGDGGPATSAEMNGPYGVAVDSAGNLYIADSNNNAVRMVAAATGTGIGGISTTAGYIYTVAGNGTTNYTGDGGPAASSTLYNPSGVTVDSAGNLYIADTYNVVIRMVAATTGTMFGKSATAGDIYTIAGNGTLGYTGDGGPATSATLNNPYGVAVDGVGNLYIGDTDNNSIRKVSANTIQPTTAVGATSASQNVLVELTTASTISSISVPRAQNNVQEFTVGAVTGCNVTGGSNASGTVCTVPITFSPQYPGQRTGALTLYSSGTTVLGSVGLSGTGNGPLVALTPGTISTVAGNGTAGFTGDGSAATSAELFNPYGVAVDGAGNLYIADQNNSRIRKVDTSGIITTVAGNGTQGYSGDGAAATSAKLYYPMGVAVDSAGNLYIADLYNQRIRKVNNAGIISTVAGNGTAGYNGDGIPATSAELNYSYGVAVDSAGNFYIADTSNGRIRKVTAATGIITTVAGNGTQGYNGDGGAATSAELSGPRGLAVDNAGNIYIADRNNNRIRKVVVSTGDISTVAGGATGGYSGDGAAATSAELYQPSGVAVDNAGNLYIADFNNNRIRKVDTSGIITTVAGDGGSGFTGDGAAATSAELYYPFGVTLDSVGNLYIADSSNNRIRKIDVSASSLAFANTAIGATSSDSPQTATVSNIGNAALTLSVPTSGLNPSITTNFTLGNSGTCPQLDTTSSAATLASGSSCTLLLSFAPTTGGALTGTASIADNSPNATQTINLSGTGIAPATTTTTLHAPSTAVYGASTTLTATVLSGGSPVTTGTVTFYNGSASLGTGTVNSSGVATLTTSALPGGSDSLTASYGATTDYAASTSTASNVTITAATTTTTMHASATAVYGASTTLTATVLSGGSPVTTGTVTFYNGSASLGTGRVNSSGVATLTTSALPGGSDSLTASYGATTDYAASTSTASNVTITAATTTTTMHAPATAVYGASTTLTATVLSGGSPVTTGTVTFYNGSASLGTGTVNSSGVATLTTSALPGGSDSLTASYGATTDYAASTSTAVTMTVASGAPVTAGTTTAVTANPTSITAGGNVTLTAMVKSSSGVPTGAVTFTSGDVSLGIANLSGGVATLTTTTLPVGTDTITASYGGAATFAASSGTTSVTVATATPASYTLVPASPSLSITQGQTGNTTLTLNPVGGYSGTVIFSCQNLPANAVCVFTQNPVKLIGNNQPVHVGLTIQTSVQQARIEATPKTTQSPLSPVLPALAFWWPGGLAGLAAIRRKRKLSKTQQRWLQLQLCLLLVVTGALAAGLSGCGGGGFGTYVTPAGNTTVTVLATGTSGGNVTTQTVALTITIAQ